MQTIDAYCPKCGQKIRARQCAVAEWFIECCGVGIVTYGTKNEAYRQWNMAIKTEKENGTGNDL